MSTADPVQQLLQPYPKTLTLDDGTIVTVRPLVGADQPALLSFFRAIPADDRWWLREDVGDPAVIRRWIAELDYNRVLPLIAIADGVIVADATLHRRGFGARHRVGEVRVVVAPAYRGRGLAYALLIELTDLASRAGLARVEAEIVARAQTGAFEAAEQIGFEQAAILPDHLDGPDGAPHDLLYLVYHLTDTGVATGHLTDE